MRRYRTDPYFGFSVPTSVPGVEPHLLYPMKTWKDKAAFDKTARELVKMFQDNFTKFEEQGRRRGARRRSRSAARGGVIAAVWNFQRAAVRPPFCFCATRCIVPPMQQRQLGKNGPRVSALGLGCMAFSGGYARADDAESIATIHAALDAGISYLDSGDFYGMGHNEMLLREALKGRARDQAFISIKFGALRTPDLKWNGYDLRPDAIRNFLTYSLKRLGTDYIDLYQPARLDTACRSRMWSAPSPISSSRVMCAMSACRRPRRKSMRAP